MSHFAEINKDNVVIRVCVGNNDDPSGDEGHSWLVENLGGRWIKTSYNGGARKNFASIGSTYNEELDAFIAPKPFKSWVLNKATCQWQAPKPYPTDGFTYSWNEAELAWELMNFSEPEA